MNLTFQFRRGTAAQWTASNRVLRDGEPGWENDTRKLKIGDGLLPWNSLGYIGDDEAATFIDAYTKAEADAKFRTIEDADNTYYSKTAATANNAATLALIQDLQDNPVEPADRPHQFRVGNDPATHGDGKLLGDVSVTNGSGVLTSAGSGFVGAAVGQWVMVSTIQGSIIGQITNVANAPAQVTIDTNALSNETGLAAVFGTDDTTGINNTVAAAKAYAEAHGYAVDVLFDDKIYIVAGLTKTSNGSAFYNAQIPIPYPTDNNGRKLVMAFKGVARTDHLDYWNAEVPSLAGTTVVSMKRGVTSMDLTYGWQSVFGAPVPDAGLGGDLIMKFINHKPVFENIQVVLPLRSGMTGFNFSWSSGFYIDGCSTKSFANAFGGNGLLLKDAYTAFDVNPDCGLRGTEFGSNADSTIGHFSAEGLNIGFSGSGEHVTVGSFKFIYMGVCIQVTDTNQGHGIWIDRVTAEAYQGGLQYKSGGANKCPIHIGLWNTEVDPSAYDIHDPGGSFYGEVHWCDPVDSRNLFVNGADNLRIIDDNKSPGNWSGKPAVPSSGTDQQNTAWRDAAVSLIGGTVTDVKVDGVTVAASSNQTVFVPSGKNIKVTYSAAPTWAWTLL